MQKDEFKKIAGILNSEAKENEAVFDSDFEGFQCNIEKALLYLLDAMFPTYAKYPEKTDVSENKSEKYLEISYGHLFAALKRKTDTEKARFIADSLFKKAPEIYEDIKLDIIAGYKGDPAAKSPDEIILSYPAFIAIGTYRIAHELYLLDEKLSSRLMSEYAHKKTGIDIHPGATIGKSFFIDHGTGVVIGETTVIGDNVKLYQHVTLGAKSFPVNDDGSLVKGIKRHPDIGNNVVIYAGATILGGDVKIGDNCVIGGNVWLTESVPAGQTVLQDK